MNRSITVLFLLLVLTIHGLQAQESGKVSVHADPRLSMVLSHNRVVEKDDEPAATKPAASKKVKPVIAASAPAKRSMVHKSERVARDVPPVALGRTVTAETKYLNNGEDDTHIIEKEKDPKAKARGLTRDDADERTQYLRNKLKEKETGAAERSTDEEIRAYREQREQDRGVKSNPKQKIGRTGIAADEVRYLSPTVSGTSRGGKYNGNGFRVQIYYGPNRDEAMRRKAEFMRHYPGVPTYLLYASPTYRVKVGDYRRREDAYTMFREANGTYSPCMIVPDNISIR